MNICFKFGVCINQLLDHAWIAAGTGIFLERRGLHHRPLYEFQGARVRKRGNHHRLPHLVHICHRLRRLSVILRLKYDDRALGHRAGCR